MRRQKVFWIVLVVCALAGAMLVLYATDLGIGVSPDSTVYINVARLWLIRLGIPLVAGNTSNWMPPGYPILLASGGYLLKGQDPFVVARWLAALFFALNIACVGLILRLALPRSFWIPLIGMWLMLTGVNMLVIHTMAWSEPPFLFCSLVGLTALAIYLEHPRTRILLIASACIAASLLIRYAGAALVATGVVALLVWNSRAWGQRVRAAAGFVMLTCAPLVAWSLTHSSDRQLVVHVMPIEWFFSASSAVANWFLPAEISFVPIRLGLVTVGLGGLGLALVLAKNDHTVRQMPRTELAANRVPTIVRVLWLYVLFYGLVILTTKLFVDSAILLDSRTFGPIFPMILIGLLYLGQRLVFSGTQVNPRRIIVGAIAIVWSIVYLLAGLVWAETSHRDGQWYSSLAWQHSEIMQQVKALPPTTYIYSNGNDAISFLTSRPASRLPDKVSGDTMLANPDYATDMAHIGTRLAGDTVIVFLSGFEDRWFLPTEQELVTQWNLYPIVRASDGTIYRGAP